MTLIGLMDALTLEHGALDFNILEQIITSDTNFPSSSSVSENDETYSEMCETYSSILNLKSKETNAETRSNLQSEGELLVRTNQEEEEYVELQTNKNSLPKLFIDYGRTLEGLLGKLNDLSPPSTGYEGDDQNSKHFSVNEPLCGTDKVGKFETFKDKEDFNSKIIYSSSFEVETTASVVKTFPVSHRTTENLGYISETSPQIKSFSKAVEKEKPSFPLLLETEAFVDDTSPRHKSFSKAIEKEKPSFPSELKAEASVKKAFPVSYRTTENLGYESKTSDTSQQNKPFSKSIEKKKPIFPSELKAEASVKKEFPVSYPTTENLDILSETTGTSRQNKPFLKAIRKVQPSSPSGSKIETSAEKTLLDCNRTTKNPEVVRVTIEEVNNNITDKPLLIDNEECTDYHLTPNISTVCVIRKARLVEVGDPWVVRCSVVPLTCNFCGDEFRSRDVLLEHKKREHLIYSPSLDPISCKLLRRYCIVVGYGRSSRVHYKCSHCQKKFRSVGAYARHCNDKICKELRGYLVSPFVKQAVLDNGEIGFECWLCQQSSESYVDMKFHECIVRRPEDLEETISVCLDSEPETEWDGEGTDEDTTSDFSVEVKEKPAYTCLECGVVLRIKSHFFAHVAEHAETKRFECKLCFKNFSRACNFKTHMERQHKDSSSSESSDDWRK